jgi:hypothetical protein
MERRMVEWKGEGCDGKGNGGMKRGLVGWKGE